MSLRTIFSLIIAAALGASLAACGGGGVSTGGGGSGTGGTGVTSSIVLQVSGGGAAGVWEEPEPAGRLAAVADFLISRALAQTDTIYLLVDDGTVDGQVVDQDTPDGSGRLIFAVAPGTYFVCSSPDLTNCVQLNVGENQVVVADVTVNLDGTVTLNSATTENAEDNIATFQDPDQANKTIICHQTGAGEFSISVSTPAVVDGHLAHGDRLGFCDPGNEQTGGPPGGGAPGGTGPPEGAGPPEDVGPPEGAGPPESAGPPDNRGNQNT